MDIEAFFDFGFQLSRLKTYPYFDFAHAIVCCLAIREDMGSGARQFSRKYPFSLWVSSMLYIFAGGMLANCMIGEPIIATLKYNNTIFLSSIAWYLTFYTPFDFGYKIFKYPPLKMVFELAREVLRVKQVNDGVIHASKIFLSSYMIMIIVGTLKGNGECFMRIFVRLIRGVWLPESTEFVQPTFATKSSALAAFLFALHLRTGMIATPASFVHLCVIFAFIYFKIMSVNFEMRMSTDCKDVFTLQFWQQLMNMKRKTVLNIEEL